MHAMQARARLSSIGLLALVPFQPSAVTAINASIAQVPLSSQAASQHRCSTALTKTIALASVYPVCLTLATAAVSAQTLLQNAHQQSSCLIHIEQLIF